MRTGTKDGISSTMTEQMMTDKETVMGKHDKVEKLTAQIMPNEWYEARIRTLERENLTLKHEFDKEQEAYEYGDQMSKQVIAELRCMVDDLTAENSKLKERLIREVLK